MVAKATIPILSEWKIRRVKGKKKKKKEKSDAYAPSGLPDRKFENSAQCG
jgi:hypothetical protein